MPGPRRHPHAEAQDQAQADGQREVYVGRSVHRSEDARLVTGRARWTANLLPPGTLHLGVVRAPMAHARIERVDLRAAQAQPGVVAAFSGEDAQPWWVQPPDIIGPEGAHKPRQWPVAIDKVRYVGEPVAVVVAETAAQAQDAVDLVDVDYDQLPAVPTIAAALEDEALVHEDIGTNVVYRAEGAREGDLDAIVRVADAVVRRTYTIPRVMSTALEARSVLAEPQADGHLVVHTSTQSPHRLRDMIASALGLGDGELDVIAPDVGGGFGPKLSAYAEDLLCTAIARRLDRPVTFTATRTEDLQTTTHGRGIEVEVTVAARRDGTLLGLGLEVTGDCGAWLTRIGGNIHLNGNKIGPGCYRWEAFRFDAKGVFTTATPTAAYRGAGRPEAAFVLERAIDDVAHELAMDPAELRRRNFPSPEEFPFASIGGLTYDVGDYAAGLDAALTAVDYDHWRQQQRERRASGSERLLGIGLSSYLDRCGVGPGVSEFGSVQINSDGEVVVYSGLGPSGQGTATSLAQIVADALDVEIDRIEVVHGDTSRVASGTGTFGSRSMAVGGVAVSVAAEGVVEEARRALAHLLEVDEADLEVRDGGVAVRGAPDTHHSYGRIAAAVERGEVPGMSELTCDNAFEPGDFTYPSGSHAVVVEVDTQTGQVEILRFVAVDDCGEAINPALLEGQIHGGIAQGIGQALFEGVSYDQDGNLLTGTLIDYLVPTAPDLPDIQACRTVTRGSGPLGVKGAGESGTIGAPPAVVNAVVDALRHLGVQDVTMPCTPERVWRAIDEASPASG